tara:strand:+ start:303 stop:659 length:357 start_codon:yes stop_codon:yes gene_type:complete
MGKIGRLLDKATEIEEEVTGKKNDITSKNIQCTAKWKEMRNPDTDAYYFKEFVNWVVRKSATAIINNSEECLEDQLIEMGDFINDVHFSPHKYLDKYYYQWLEEWVMDFYNINQSGEA